MNRPLMTASLLTTALLLAGCAAEPQTSAPATSTADAQGDSTVDMIDVAYAPKDIRVRAGSTVTFRNLDDMGHTVTADDASQWGTGGSGDAPDQWMMKDDTWSWTFDTPGTYRYHCLPHATKAGDGYMGMAGTITVV